MLLILYLLLGLPKVVIAVDYYKLIIFTSPKVVLYTGPVHIE